MPSRLSTGSSRPTATASSAEPISELATGSSVKVRFGHAASIISAFSGLPVISPISVLARDLASSALAFTNAVAATWPSRNCCTTSGCSSRNFVATITWVVTYWPSGHRSRSSTSTLPPPSWINRVAHGSGTHAPWMSPERNVCRVWLFSWGAMLTSPPPASSELKPFSFSHERSATSWVLPRLGVARTLPFRSAGLLISGFTTRKAPPEVAPEMTRTAAPSLLA